MAAPTSPLPRAAEAPDHEDEGGSGSGGTPAALARPDRLGLALGVGVVVLYAVATVATRSLWVDEAYTVAAIHDPWLSLTRTHGTMGLYYVLLWAWGQVSVDAWWVRVPSVLFALATLWVVRDVARRIGGRTLAAWAVPLVALQPLFQLKATEARSYSLMTLLVAVAWAIVLRSLDDDRARWPLLFLLTSVAGVMAQGLFVVHVAPMVLLLVTAPRPRRLVATIAPGMAAAAAIAWLLRSSGADTIGTFVRGGPVDWLVSALDAFLQGPPLAQVILVVGLVLGARTAVRSARRSTDPVARTAWLVPVVWALGPVLALGAMSLAIPRFNPRYLTPITPALGLLLAVALDALGRSEAARERFGRMATVGAATLVVLALLGGLVTAENPREDWRTVAGQVADQVEPGDALLFANLGSSEPEQHRPPFEVAWAEADHDEAPTVVSSARPLGEARRYEDGIRTPAEMARAARDHPRVWIVGGTAGGSVPIDEIVGDPAFAGLALVESWAIESDIDLRLYEWRG